MSTVKCRQSPRMKWLEEKENRLHEGDIDNRDNAGSVTFFKARRPPRKWNRKQS